ILFLEVSVTSRSMRRRIDLDVTLTSRNKIESERIGSGFDRCQRIRLVRDATNFDKKSIASLFFDSEHCRSLARFDHSTADLLDLPVMRQDMNMTVGAAEERAH